MLRCIHRCLLKGIEHRTYHQHRWKSRRRAKWRVCVIQNGWPRLMDSRKRCTGSRPCPISGLKKRPPADFVVSLGADRASQWPCIQQLGTTCAIPKSSPQGYSIGYCAPASLSAGLVQLTWVTEHLVYIRTPLQQRHAARTVGAKVWGAHRDAAVRMPELQQAQPW